MRYIYYILIIFLVLSAALGYELLSSPVPAKDTAMSINGRVVTIHEFNRLCASPPHRLKAQCDSINYLITRELLIQEAQREGIDKEESFRKSIQNFYEQSLVKLLMDKKFDSIKVSVSDEELGRYMSFLGRKIHLTVFTSDTLEAAEKGNYKDTKTREMNFEDLSSVVRDRIVPLKGGEKTKPLREGDKFVVLRLDKAENSLHVSPSEKERESIRKMLMAEKRETMMDDWVAGLRKKADVKVLLNQNN
jgi:hypothetical protein